MNKDSLVYVSIFTFVVSLFFAFGLNFIKASTQERVDLNRKKVEQQAILRAAGISFAPGKENETFKKYFPGITDYNSLLKADVDGKTIYVQKQRGAGLWSNISLVLAVDEAVDRVLGLEIVEQTETPGLGARIEEKDFRSQYFGEKISPKGIEMKRGDQYDKDKENSQVDGITGATLTSVSVEAIVNNGIRKMREEVGK